MLNGKEYSSQLQQWPIQFRRYFILTPRSAVESLQCRRHSVFGCVRPSVSLRVQKTLWTPYLQWWNKSWARGSTPPRCRLAPNCEIYITGQESGGALCEIFKSVGLIVSAVKICKQCLQTASVSGENPQTQRRGFVPGTNWGLPSQCLLGYSSE